MISFKSFITEDVNLAANIRKAIVISKHIDNATQKQKFLDAIETLALGAESKEIYNARFSDARESLVYRMELAYRRMIDPVTKEMITHGDDTSGWWSISMSDITKKTRTLNQMKNKPAALAEFMGAVASLPDAMKELKKYIKAGRPPQAPVPGQFIKPMANFEATKLAKQYMEDAVSSFRMSFEEDIHKNTYATYNRIKDIRDPAVVKKLTGHDKIIAGLVFMLRNKTIELLPNAQNRVDNAIRDTVDSVIGQFVAKNTIKIALIFQKKSGIRSHEILNTNIRNNTVENTMKFTFNDNSSFYLDSQVIYKTTSTGKLFTQFPTRFSNVVMPDGSRMSSPSEEKIIKEF